LPPLARFWVIAVAVACAHSLRSFDGGDQTSNRNSEDDLDILSDGASPIVTGKFAR